MKPASLECNSLTTPLGVDESHPLLSWKLQDTRRGARQTAYEIFVASKPELLKEGAADIWDSKRVASDQSTGVAYSGPALTAMKRYYWRVQAWDQNGNPYPLSDPSWWETGLLNTRNWQAQWIGYEDEEHHAVRAAEAKWITNPAVEGYKGNSETHHAFRLPFDLSKQVKTAALYVTGEDTVGVWINGKQVLTPQHQPKWGRTPWKTYQRREITTDLHAGKNLLAIEVTHFPSRDQSQAPMSATLYLKLADGSTQIFKTGTGDWKATFQAKGDWYSTQFDDSSWAQAVLVTPQRNAFGDEEALGLPLQTSPVAALRRSFKISSPVLSARLYATALGLYKFSLNGKTVGDQALSPGWTDYRQRVTYQVYDVTSLLKQGANAIGAYLAPGWYSTPLEWVGQGNNYGKTPNALKAQLRIEHANGSVEWIATDEAWKAELSPITSAEIYDGESYDARKLQSGWSSATFADASWHPVEIIHPAEPEIVWQSFPPVRETGVLEAKTVNSPKPGVYVYDFGQEIAGVTRIRVQGAAGTDVQLRFAEVLDPDGSLYVENLRNAKATDHYILAGKGVEEYQPSFTFHGFRYVEISGVKSAPALSDVKAVVLNTDAPLTTKLVTGSHMVNLLWSNIRWGQRSNFLSVPTDCPQRDERLGWTADAQVFWRTATYNMDLAAFSRKYATDLRGTQVGTPMYGIYAPGTTKPNPGYGTGWSDAGVIVPWTSWIQTGDRSILEQNWPAMEKYLAAIESANPDHLWKKDYGIAFGDWLSPEGSTPEDLIATAYWAYDVTLMKQMAHQLGKSEDERKYADLFEKIKAAFIQAYVSPNGKVSALPSGEQANEKTQRVETQTSYVLALHMNLLPDALRSIAAQKLVDRIASNGWKLGTGFLGTPYLLEELTKSKHADVAYQLLLNTQYPSWGYMVEHGATTMWERWNGDQMRADPGMNSYNHYAYGSVAEWIYRYAAGVDTDASDPGFHTIVLHPNFDERLAKLDFSYDSPYGDIRSAWTAENGQIEWKITIPANAKATLALTTKEAQDLSIDGEPLQKSALIKSLPKQENIENYEILAGTYTLTQKSPRP